MAQITADLQKLVQVDDPSTVDLEAWYMDDVPGDQRLPHKTNQRVSVETLYKLGVLYWKLDADKYESDPKLAAIRQAYNWNWMEILTMNEAELPNYEEKIKGFYEEHIHTYDEIRYILDGSGYFDIRDFEDRWIRILVKKGGFIVLPEGSYHRFTTDANNHAKAMRLFIGEAVWKQYRRPQDTHEARLKYLAKHGQAAAVA